MTFGPRGTHLNLGIPGTGFSFRTRLDSKIRGKLDLQVDRFPENLQKPREVFDPIAENIIYPDRYLLPDEGEIKSAGLTELTSEGLGALKQLIDEAHQSRRFAELQIKHTLQKLQKSRATLKRARTFILRLFYRHRYRDIASRVSSLQVELSGFVALAEASHLNIDFALGNSARQAYSLVEDAFALIAQSHCIWDNTAAFYTERIKERTVATRKIARQQVSFRKSTSILVATEWDTLYLGNINGEDIQIYPGFILVLEKHTNNYALIEWSDIELIFTSVNFQEDGNMPNDSKEVGQTWTYANKDGSPDRRYNNNYLIPIMRYGQITLRSSSGLHEEYLISNADSAQVFSEACILFKNILVENSFTVNDILPVESHAADDQQTAETMAENLNKEGQPPLIWYLLGDIVSMVLIVWGLFWYFSFQSIPHVQSQSPPKPSVVASSERTSVRLAKVSVSVKSANIRSAPLKTAPIVKKSTFGEKLLVFDEKNGWFNVGDLQPIGWIRSDLVKSED
jgi:hypothetical protein